MIIRSAFWIGQVRPGLEEKFRSAIDGELMPEMRRFPGVRNVYAMWPQKREDDPPNIACQIMVEFDDLQERDRMLASPERAQLRPRNKEVAAMFDGKMSHIEYEVGSH